MPNQISNYIKDVFNSTVASGELHYSDHEWALNDNVLMQREPVTNHRASSIAREFTWFIFDYLLQSDKAQLLKQFPQILQSFSDIISQEMIFNSTSRKKLVAVPERFTKANARTGSVATFNYGDMLLYIRSNLPKVEIAKSVLQRLAKVEPVLQARIDLLLNINDYLIKREAESEHLDFTSSVMARLDFMGIANRCGHNFAKQHKLAAVKALRTAIIAGDDISTLDKYESILNSGRTRSFYQSYMAIQTDAIHKPDSMAVMMHKLS